jgi:hypothetical protein
MPSILEDRDEILQLLHRYNHCFDGGDAWGWADTFTPDGVEEVVGGVTFCGRQELAAHVKEITGERHVVVNPVIEVRGDTATVRAYLLLYRGVELGVTGSYEDDLVRTPDGWRFTKRKFTFDGLSEAYRVQAEEYLAGHPELVRNTQKTN